jgi:hypothetical protein
VNNLNYFGLRRVLMTLFFVSALTSNMFGQQYALDSLTKSENPIATDIHLNGVMDDYHSKRPITSGKVIISNELNEVSTIPVDSMGRWIELIPCDHIYRVDFTAEGYATKHVIIDARSIPLEEQLGGFSMDIDITLFKAIDGVDYTLLEKPIGVSRYDTYTYSISWDSDQVVRMQDQMKQFMKLYDRQWKESGKRKD